MELIFYQVEKKEIERMKFGRIREFISSLGKDQYQSVAIMIDGYNDVVEELYEIKEVRAWYKEFINKFPHIFYFLDQELTETHKIALSCVSEIKFTAYAGELRKPISEYKIEELIFGNIPRTNVMIVPNNKTMAKIARKTIEYGASVGDMERAVFAMKNIANLFNGKMH